MSAPAPTAAGPIAPAADPPVLPNDLAAAFDAAADAGVDLVVRHPDTGARLRVVGQPQSVPRPRAVADGPPVTTTLLEDVEEALADVAAGRCVPWEEHVGDRTKHLARLLRANGFDPEDHIPREALDEAGL